MLPEELCLAFSQQTGDEPSEDTSFFAILMRVGDDQVDVV